MKQGRWIKERKKIKDYPKTEHQEKIAEAGKEIGLECTGKTGDDFRACRCNVLAKYFKVECPIKELNL